MTIPKRKRGQTMRVRDATLPTFLASPLSAARRMQAIEILSALKTYPHLVDADLRSRDPALFARADNYSEVGLDLFRILRGEPPLRIGHSRRNVGAQLRYQRRRLGRTASEQDFPPGHVVPLLACVYYRGMERWAAHCDDRQQHPKGYWHDRGNQLTALRSYVASYPGKPITQNRLTAAGYSALAKAITVQELSVLVYDIGMQRRLQRPSAGHWTEPMIIDAYVNMCRVHDRALSNHDLTYLGKAGYALRGRVATVFSDWRTFRQRVAAVHPDMPAEPLPIAKDGTLLDSFAEVAVYNALRAGLPADTCIIPHVLIGVAACSSDFVVAERVVVEVLMLALEEIASPRSQLQVAYAAKWMRKVAIYAERGTALVVIEPADANTAAALAAKVAEVARLLRLPDPPPPISVVAGRIRPKGWWSHATLCRVLGQVAAEVGQFPTFEQLAARGYGHATNLLKRRGCRMRVSRSIGWPTTVRKRPARSRPT